MSLFSGKRGGPDGPDQAPPQPPPQPKERRQPIRDQPSQRGGTVADIGKSIVFKGDLSGDEDLQIDGQVEGGVQLANHQLTIGETGRVQAQLYAKSVIVIGHVTGNITATERVEIQVNGIVEGDVHTPRLIVADGAVLNGGVEMSKPQTNAGAKPAGSAPEAKPAASPQ